MWALAHFVRAWREDGAAIQTGKNSAKVLMSHWRLSRSYRNPGGHRCKRSMPPLVDSFPWTATGHLWKGLLVGTQPGETICLVEAQRRQAAATAAGQRILLPLPPTPPVSASGSRKRERRTLPLGQKQEWLGLREVACHWGKSRIKTEVGSWQ